MHGVNLMLGCCSEASVTVSCRPGEVESCPHLLVHLLVNGATKPCPAVHIRMKLEFSHLIANCKAVLGHSGFRGFKLHLVASQPLEPSTSGPRDVKVHIQPRLICYLLYHVLILVFPSRVRPEG